MADTWRAAVLEQAELVSDRVRRLASSGLLFLHDEYGLDLGLKPELWPTWLLVTAAVTGLLLAVWWLVACGGAARKKRAAGTRERKVNVNVSVTEPDTGKNPTVKTGKPEEPNKKKKKPSEKKTQPNGRTVPEPREEGKVLQEIPKQAAPPPSPPKKAAAPPARTQKATSPPSPPTKVAAPPSPPQKAAARPQKAAAQPSPPPQKAAAPPSPPLQAKAATAGAPPPQAKASPPPQTGAAQPPADTKADKAKKNKKKPKPEVKPSQTVTTTDGKEPEEGAWETKISNREKRQQRKKEKGPGDDSGSPGGGNHVGQQTEQPVVSAPKSTKKNKESLTSKAEKHDAVVAPAASTWNPVSSVNSGGWNEMSTKLPSQVSASDGEKWSVSMKSTGHRSSEPLAWGHETEGSWTGKDGRMKTELNTNFSMLGLNSSTGDSVTQSAGFGKWDIYATVDNEWSGFNGLGAADPSSDWSAPTEVWGNYEEPKVETPAAQEAPASQPPRNVAQLPDSDDDKEKGDPSGTGKSKRKKKKKKKPEDENAAPKVNNEGLPAESSAVKPRPNVPQDEPAKQNIMPPVSQKNNDQNRDPPKQVQKKKARRET